MDLPWLMGPMQPRIFGPYDAIRRDYRIEEYLQDIKDSGIGKSVYVQANWAPDQFEEEVAWVQSVADSHGWPHAIVGYVDLLQDDVSADLRMLRKHPLMRGIRQQLHWHERTSNIASPHHPIYRPIQSCRRMSRSSLIMAGASTCRCLHRK